RSACVQDVHRGCALPENDSGCAPTARLSAESSDIYSRSTPPSNFEIGSNDASGDWVEKVRANGRVVWGPYRKNLPSCLLRCEVRHWVAEQLLARARQLSARPLSEPPTGPESEILWGLFPSLFFWHRERTPK